jgi:hypothetical protein
MTRGIFIVGNESALTRAIEKEASGRVEQYAASFIPNRLSGATKNIIPANDKRIQLDWNPSSPLSARTLVLAAENRLENINEAILVCSPPTIRSNAADIPMADVEVMVNDHVKGWFFLIREIAAVFTTRQSGNLALVYPEINTGSSGKEDAADILGPAALAAFRSLTYGLLSSAHNEVFHIAGFSCADTGNEEGFAAFMFKNIDEASKRNNGKLHKFGKFNLFK